MRFVLFVLVFAILLFAFFGFITLLLGLSMKSLVQRVAKEGSMTEGRVRDTRSTRGDRYRLPHYYATIAYLVEGQSYEQELLISEQHYKLWTKGTPVQIHYLPSEPKRLFLLADRSEQREAFGSLLAAGFMFVAAVGMLILTVVLALRGVFT